MKPSADKSIEHRSQTTVFDIPCWITVIGFALYLALFGFVSVSRSGHFEPDSMNYVNVARNILAGKGLTQSTLGFNQRDFSLDAKIPVPFTAQAPLYPVLIALVSRVGLSTTSSALLLPAIAYAATFLLVYKLAAEFYDQKTALVTIGVLSIYQPLHTLANYALSDAVAIAFALLSFWLLVKRSETARSWLLLFSGFAAGLAFATRYAFLPLFGANILFLLINSANWRRTFLEICLYALGVVPPAAVVCGHNLVATGSILPVLGPHSGSFIQGVIKTRILFERYLGTWWPHLQVALLALSLLAFCGLLIAKGDFLAATRDIFFSRRRNLLILWSTVYLIFLVIVTSRSQQQLERRFFVPAGVTLLILWSAVAIRAVDTSFPRPRGLVLALLALAIGQEAVAAHRHPVLDFGRKIQNSERLSWLAADTSDQDLIIGDNTVDAPFFLNRPFIVSFSDFHYTKEATYEKVVGYAQQHCSEYRNIYLVLHDRQKTEEQWRFWYGDFFANLVFGKLEKYPSIILLRRLRDGVVFQIVCQ